MPFDIQRAEVTGPEMLLVQDVQYGFVGGGSDVALADDGTMVYTRATQGAAAGHLLIRRTG